MDELFKHLMSKRLSEVEAAGQATEEEGDAFLNELAAWGLDVKDPGAVDGVTDALLAFRSADPREQLRGALQGHRMWAKRAAAGVPEELLPLGSSASLQGVMVAAGMLLLQEFIEPGSLAAGSQRRLAAALLITFRQGETQNMAE